MMSKTQENGKQALLLGSIDISAAGGGKGLLGDIDGDGRMELVVVQGDSGIDDRYVPHQVTCVTAYRLTGELLWQVGKAGEKPGNFGSDFPAQIYDIDGDGRLEILCVMEKEFQILDGATGELKRKFALPDPYAHDCIIIANLRGGAHPADIILKDRYRRLWALDQEFRLLWTHEGNVGHFPWAFDINGDGFDEVMAGYDLLDHNGKLLWSCHDLEDHADCLWTGDVNGDGVPEIVVGGGVMPGLYDGDGRNVVIFPRDGYVLHGDLFGRGREEVIVYDLNRAWIFSGTEYSLEEAPLRKPLPQPRRLYSSTLYPGGNYEEAG